MCVNQHNHILISARLWNILVFFCDRLHLCCWRLCCGIRIGSFLRASQIRIQLTKQRRQMCERVGGSNLAGASRRRLGLTVRKRLCFCALSFTLHHCRRNTKRSDEVLAINIGIPMLCKTSRKASVCPTSFGKMWQFSHDTIVPGPNVVQYNRLSTLCGHQYLRTASQCTSIHTRWTSGLIKIPPIVQQPGRFGGRP